MDSRFHQVHPPPRRRLIAGSHWSGKATSDGYQEGGPPVARALTVLATVETIRPMPIPHAIDPADRDPPI